MADLSLAVFGGSIAAWVVAEACLTSRDRPVPGTLALPTGLLVLAGQLGGVIEHVTRGSAVASSAAIGAIDHVARSPAAASSSAIGAAVLAAGIALFAAGIALRLWSIATLGPGFATALDSPRLVTSGPYRRLRHPSELGQLAAMLGTSLVVASWFALAAALAALPIAVIRCRREDAALARRHRIGHAAWSRRVGWLGPR